MLVIPLINKVYFKFHEDSHFDPSTFTSSMEDPLKKIRATKSYKTNQDLNDAEFRKYLREPVYSRRDNREAANNIYSTHNHVDVSLHK